MAERMMTKGLWLNDKNAVVGMSNINPLLQKKAKVKPLKLPKARPVLGVVKTPKPFKAMAHNAITLNPAVYPKIRTQRPQLLHLWLLPFQCIFQDDHRLLHDHQK